VSAAGSMPPGDRRGEQPHNIAAAIAEVSDRATLLVREEIELAKAEVTEKAIKLLKGAIVGVAAGIFFITALQFALVGCAWLLYYFIPGGDFTYFWGFFAMAAILVILGVIAGLIAARVMKKSSPPVPSMAIEEARKIRDTVTAGSPAEVPPLAGATPFVATPAAAPTFAAESDPAVAAPAASSAPAGIPSLDPESDPAVAAPEPVESVPEPAVEAAYDELPGGVSGAEEAADRDGEHARDHAPEAGEDATSEPGDED